jgi:hypothetical protein
MISDDSAFFYRYCNWIGNKLHDQALPSAVHSCSVVRSYPTFMLNRMSITVNTKSAIRSYPEALQSTLHLLMYHHQSRSYKGYSPDEGSMHLWNVFLREYTAQYPKRLSPLYSRLRIWYLIYAYFSEIYLHLRFPNQNFVWIYFLHACYMSRPSRITLRVQCEISSFF